MVERGGPRWAWRIRGGSGLPFWIWRGKVQVAVGVLGSGRIWSGRVLVAAGVLGSGQIRHGEVMGRQGMALARLLGGRRCRPP